ncbi:hypothetical protein C8J56DRAFT_1124191 [Mycena floridula]|nr:hypothetical protein C8J56DRAFT_1124191 [Mycena floridula]
MKRTVGEGDYRRALEMLVGFGEEFGTLEKGEMARNKLKEGKDFYSMATTSSGAPAAISTASATVFVFVKSSSTSTTATATTFIQMNSRVSLIQGALALSFSLLGAYCVAGAVSSFPLPVPDSSATMPSVVSLDEELLVVLSSAKQRLLPSANWQIHLLPRLVGQIRRKPSRAEMHAWPKNWPQCEPQASISPMVQTVPKQPLSKVSLSAQDPILSPSGNIGAFSAPDDQGPANPDSLYGLDSVGVEADLQHGCSSADWEEGTDGDREALDAVEEESPFVSGFAEIIGGWSVELGEVVQHGLYPQQSAYERAIFNESWKSNHLHKLSMDPWVSQTNRTSQETQAKVAQWTIVGGFTGIVDRWIVCWTRQRRLTRMIWGENGLRNRSEPVTNAKEKTRHLHNYQWSNIVVQGLFADETGRINIYKNLWRQERQAKVAQWTIVGGFARIVDR